LDADIEGADDGERDNIYVERLETLATGWPPGVTLGEPLFPGGVGGAVVGGAVVGAGVSVGAGVVGFPPPGNGVVVD